MLKNTLAAFAFGAATLFAGSAAMAAQATVCSSSTPDVTSYVENTSACYVLSGTENNGNVNTAGGFNATQFANHSDWDMIEKIDPYGTGDHFAITGSVLDDGKLLEGDWEVFVTAVTSMYSEFALLFKAGDDGNTAPNTEVGYVLSGSSGEWESMIFSKNPQNGRIGNAKAISHVILFGRGECNPQTDICGPGVGVVPVPAGLPLLLSALGLGVAVRRFKKRG